MVKNLPANADDKRDLGSIPGSGRSPGGEHGNPLQCSCLKNPMDRGAWGAKVNGVTQNRSQLKQLSMHARPVPVDKTEDGLPLKPEVRASKPVCR